MPVFQAYHILEATSRVELITQVNSAILDGWHCQGGLIVCRGPATTAVPPQRWGDWVRERRHWWGRTTRFYQAMVRHE